MLITCISTWRLTHASPAAKSTHTLLFFRPCTIQIDDCILFLLFPETFRNKKRCGLIISIVELAHVPSVKEKNAIPSLKERSHCGRSDFDNDDDSENATLRWRGDV